VPERFKCDNADLSDVVGAARVTAGHCDRHEFHSATSRFDLVVRLGAAGRVCRPPGASGALRVGVVVNPPWTKVDGDAVSGAETVLVQRFADSLGARAQWVPGSESEMMKALS
jgi:hypothetical protein